MNPELDKRSEYDVNWRVLEIQTNGQVSASDRKLVPGEIHIIPGIPPRPGISGDRPSEVHFMLEGHSLKLTWSWGRLAPHPIYTSRDDALDRGS
jgi:hypothetical protein